MKFEKLASVELTFFHKLYFFNLACIDNKKRKPKTKTLQTPKTQYRYLYKISLVSYDLLPILCILALYVCNRLTI